MKNHHFNCRKILVNIQNEKEIWNDKREYILLPEEKSIQSKNGKSEEEMWRKGNRVSKKRQTKNGKKFLYDCTQYSIHTNTHTLYLAYRYCWRAQK